MEEKPIKIEIIESNTEKEKNTLEDAARLAMQIKSNSDYDMRTCIGKASEETGWDTKEIAKTLATWNKPKNRVETKEEQEKRSIELGDAWKDEEGNVRYYDDRENEKE
jgi:hypothetical protein